MVIENKSFFFFLDAVWTNEYSLNIFGLWYITSKIQQLCNRADIRSLITLSDTMFDKAIKSDYMNTADRIRVLLIPLENPFEMPLHIYSNEVNFHCHFVAHVL